MRQLIKGDIARILRKKEIYIFSVILYVILFAVRSKTDVEDQIDLFQMMVTMIGVLCCTIPVYLTVYGDEIRTGSMQIVIGRGMSRRKVIVSKLIDCIILFTLMFMIFLLLFYVKNAIAHLSFTPKQNLMAFVFVLITCIRATGYFAMAGLFLFSSWNIAIGLTACVMMVFITIALNLVQQNMHIPVHDFWIDGLVASSYNDIMIGNFPWKLFLMIAVYIVGVVFITAKIFDRKELDL
ncbi:MAG: hypothetical protein IJT24_00735 [Lachnospiraceae bacterium]|nr:hypothetical protein [Lachnospiraceae bacterium]